MQSTANSMSETNRRFVGNKGDALVSFQFNPVMLIGNFFLYLLLISYIYSELLRILSFSVSSLARTSVAGWKDAIQSDYWGFGVFGKVCCMNVSRLEEYPIDSFRLFLAQVRGAERLAWYAFLFQSSTDRSKLPRG